MKITIAFVSHRIEIIPVFSKLAEPCDLIILEEPFDEHFRRMLRGEISVEDYVSESFLEFPKFSVAFYQVLKKLYDSGKEIVQIEPYQECLLSIHERLIGGCSIDELLRDNTLKEVYYAEKEASKALIDYYKVSLSGDFEEVVYSIKSFAKADAKRFRLRDSMRALKIREFLENSNLKKVIVETGYMHLYLEKCLKEIFPEVVESISVLDILAELFCNRRFQQAPGDVLTGSYIFEEEINEEFENLLAARSLIYISLLGKEERVPTLENRAPHLKEETELANFVNTLSFSQCKELYQKIRKTFVKGC